MSPTIDIFPAHIPAGDLSAFFLAGSKVATARPRFVIVIVVPSATSSKMAKHLDLNSVAPTTLCLTPLSDLKQHGLDLHGSDHSL